MSKKLYPEESVQAIADAIRSKNGSSDTYTIDEMSQAISDISGFKLKALPTGAISSISDGAALPLTKLKIGIEPVQSGSGDPSPTNIRLISGFTSANVSVCGVNVWDEEWEVGNINDGSGEDLPQNNIIRTKNYIRVMSGKSYYIKCPTSGIARLFLYAKDKSYITYVPIDNIINNIYTIPNNCEYIRFRTLAAYGTTYNNDISINYPSTDTSYHAYNGTTLIIQFTDGSNPIVVYEGVLDVLSGLLTVYRGGGDMGDLNWFLNSDWNGKPAFFCDAISNIKTPPTASGAVMGAMCSMYRERTRDYLYVLKDETGICILMNGMLGVRDSRFTTLSDFITGVTGQQFVYELATPQTYQLTPTQVKFLLGENNVWADTGDIQSGEYFAEL